MSNEILAHEISPHTYPDAQKGKIEENANTLHKNNLVIKDAL